MSLNSIQQAIVAHRDGAALVVAGPGAGKTHTLTHRCAALIGEGVYPSSILLTTFTNKAAQEIQERTVRLIGDQARGMLVGTFHSIGVRQLWKTGTRFFVMSDGEAREILAAIRKEFGIDDISTAELQSAISVAINADTTRNLQHPFRDVFAAYADRKREMGAYDFDDILITWRDTLSTDADFRDRQQHKFQYIMVDEYQDTNPIQAEIIRLLANERENVMVVGDDCQSIYGFRGADIANILRFPVLFPRAVRYDLTENYRSTTSIVAAANRLIFHAKEKIDKTLTTTMSDVSNGKLQPVTSVSCENQNAEADFIVKMIDAYQGEFILLGEMAILYRSTFHAMRIEMAINAAKIPYVKHGGRKITEAKHIRDLVSCLWILVYPKQRMAWMRVLKMLPGIGEKTAMNLSGVICASDDPVVALKAMNVPSKARTLFGYLAQWYEESESGGAWKTTQEAVAYAWSWYDQFFQEEFAEGELSFREGGMTALYEVAAKFATPTEFLNEFILDEDPTKKNAPHREKLTLSTIHSAKGREWERVFIPHCYEGAFPSYRAESYEEERRLMYVAVTRAKHSVIITRPKAIWSNDHEEKTAPSRFVREVIGT